MKQTDSINSENEQNSDISMLGEKLQVSTPLFYYREDKDQSGSTRTKGTVSLVDYGDFIELKMKVNVRKSGYSGEGRGVVSFQILDSDLKPIDREKLKRTVGAKIPEGVNDKTAKLRKIYRGSARDEILKNGYVCCATIATEYDKNGLPSNVKEWTEAIKNLKLIYDLYTGNSTAIAAWFFTKIEKK